MSRVRRFVAALLFGGVGTACAALFDLDALEGGRERQDAAPSVDAGDPSSDAGTSADATRDDRRFCAALSTETALCDDFDDPGRTALSTTGWGSFRGGPVGAVTNDAARSTPASALFETGDGGTVGPAARRAFNFPTEKAVAAYHAMLRAKSALEGRDEYLLEMDFDGCSYQLAIDPMKIFVACPSGTNLTLGVAGTLPSNAWTPVALAVERRSEAVQLTLTVGSLSVEGDVPTVVSNRTSSAAIVIGPAINGAAFYVDDVWVEVR